MQLNTYSNPCHQPLAYPMISKHFTDVRTWVFDLDNTLYPPEAALFDQIEIRMTDWVMAELGVPRARADTLRREYWATYGTTLAGLMTVHGVDPGPYLHEVHDIDFSVLSVDRTLASRITDLPGRKIVYTNGSAPYAKKVLNARGLSNVFDAIYGVEHADFHPKPQRRAFDTVFQLDGLDPSTAAMFEDDARNLLEPHNLGMRTIHVAPAAEPAEHIHFHTNDLSEFLMGVT